MKRRLRDAPQSAWYWPSLVALQLLAVLALSVTLIRAGEARDVCADASQRSVEVVDMTNALGLALVERSEAEEWYARSLATANAEHLSASLEAATPRYEAAAARCKAVTR